ncbi:slipin family protein [Flavihumibacter petaseus]|uniref:Band 7 domain-containing protein n=1 Tax=Flavihumibacter petaseus NBRC 106054 TaxID=1220578 RepID=A0A0E9N3Y0_9BACT|nr:slipin family protein [Flavihumibacter petaseus]GAO44529.1 hypothetical protein FPE01S_03_05670 [Flavihumibacter petaseus NBRC 106054]
MKHVTLNAWQVGLVFKNGAYQRTITAGSYWFWRGEQVEIYDITKPFTPTVELNVLLQDPLLSAMLQVVEVKDNAIALQYENGLLRKVLTTGRYAFWKSVIRYDFLQADISQPEIDPVFDRAVLNSGYLGQYVRTVTVENYEKALLFMDGKFIRVLEGGVYYFWKNAIPVSIARVDMRQQQLEINGQEILTKDKAALRINAWAQYTVTDIEKAVLNNKGYDTQLYVSVQLALREYVAGFAFDELLEKKDSIGAFVREAVRDKATVLGVTLHDFGIRDIVLPGDVKEIMNQVLVAEKKAQANTIMRREETASTRSLLNTARLMEENAMLWKLKEMEYVEKIAEKISNISVNGSGQLVEQLKQLFIPGK